jgi:hypothetical protein
MLVATAHRQLPPTRLAQERDAVLRTDLTDTTTRRTIASFDDHRDAQEYIDRLAERGFPVDQLVIVGRDLRVVEQVTGPLDAWRAALLGAGTGLTTGAMLGLLFGIFFTIDGTSFLAVVLYWLVVGALIGALFGVISYAFGERRRYTSESSLRASHYDVMADESTAEQAQRLLARSDGGGAH